MSGHHYSNLTWGIGMIRMTREIYIKEAKMSTCFTYILHLHISGKNQIMKKYMIENKKTTIYT